MIYYCYRNTQDWKTDSNISFVWKDEETLKRNVNFVTTWNISYKIKWSEYRGLIKEQARKNFTGIEEVFKDTWQALNDDDYIIFIDDDDCINPELISILDTVDCGFLYGDSIIFNPHNGKIDYHKQENHILSCGYCFKVKFLKSLPNKIIHYIFTYHHRLRTDVMNYNIPYIYIPKTLSCYLKHFGSASYMTNNDIYNNFIINKSIYYNKHKELPDFAKWATEYISGIFNIVKQLSESKL